MSRGKGNDTNNDKGRGRGRGRASASGPPGFEDFQASPNLLESGFRFPKSTKSGFCFNPVPVVGWLIQRTAKYCLRPARPFQSRRKWICTDISAQGVISEVQMTWNGNYQGLRQLIFHLTKFYP